jgi:hypothetical protein
MSAFAEISFELESPDGSARETRCVATYRLLLDDGTGKFRAVITFTEDHPEYSGVAIVGFSPDGSKVAADFWWMPGDYTAWPRPAVFDLTTQKSTVRKVDDGITKHLPGCDYSQDVVGVTNTGEAIIHIPRSHFPGGGCPDRGTWLFNLTSGAAHRLAPKR